MPFSSLLISCLFLLSHALWQSHWDWQTQPPPLFLECASWWQSMFCHYLPHMDPHAGILQGCSGWRSLKFAIISHVLEKLDEKFPEKTFAESCTIIAIWKCHPVSFGYLQNLLIHMHGFWTVASWFRKCSLFFSTLPKLPLQAERYVDLLWTDQRWQTKGRQSFSIAWRGSAGSFLGVVWGSWISAKMSSTLLAPPKLPKESQRYEALEYSNINWNSFNPLKSRDAQRTFRKISASQIWQR